MADMKKSMAVFSGSAHPELAQEIAQCLGVELGKVRLERFANGENYARYEQSVRGADVFIIQSVRDGRVNDALMELLIMVDAAKRASARTVTAVVPFYLYSRQDRKAASREPITAKLVANLMETAGIDRTITIDLHQGQIQGFFNTPVNHLTAMPILEQYFMKKNFAKDELCIVSPDVGRAKAAKKFSDAMEADLAIMHKGRPGHNKAAITALIGDVTDKVCIINDDMIDTGGSVVAAAETLISKGAKKVYVCATHPVFSGPAYERLESGPIEEVVVTNTIPVAKEHQNGKITVLSVAPLLADAIARVFSNESVSALGDAEL
ncbi:MAG: ribose-phosphate diphosphokinase [Eggerthellaceae bacterium]|jgi:ribose-phosphate pyrophosphokinase